MAKMSNGWYTDSLAGIGTKEAYEGIQGFWLVELGELAAMRKIEIETTKNFISKTLDSYRAAYGRRVEDHPGGVCSLAPPIARLSCGMTRATGDSGRSGWGKLHRARRCGET